jgi:catechol 2,3-dioxygenase-like lactoylglutathione lyase family enzyme
MAAVSDYLLGLRHVGVVTENLRETVCRLQEVFGIADGEITILPAGDEPAETRFAFFSIGGTPYEVIEPVSDYFREILLASNQGANHVCYNVSDLEAAVDAMAAQGVRLGHVTPEGIVTMPGFKMAYFDPRDTAGLLIEFVESRQGD